MAISADPATQLANWNRAVDLLGGQRPVAARLGCSERTIRFLCKGEKPLHAGWLEDISRLLIEHAKQCRDLEAQLMPGFRKNLTEDQAKAKPDRRRHQEKGQADG